MSPQELLIQVREKNKTLNGGRGTRVLESVCFYLERECFEDAMAVIDNNYDKLYQYEGVLPWLEEIGLYIPVNMDWLDS